MEQWMRGDFGPDCPLPSFIANKPTVPAWHSIYWEAFWELCSDRGGMGDGRILWTAMHLWARAHYLTRRQEADLVYYLRRMDTEYLSWVESKRGK